MLHYSFIVIVSILPDVNISSFAISGNIQSEPLLHTYRYFLSNCIEMYAMFSSIFHRRNLCSVFVYHVIIKSSNPLDFDDWYNTNSGRFILLFFYLKTSCKQTLEILDIYQNLNPLKRVDLNNLRSLRVRKRVFKAFTNERFLRLYIIDL